MSDDFKRRPVTIGMLVGVLVLACTVFGPLAAVGGGYVTLSNRVTVVETETKTLRQADIDIKAGMSEQKNDLVKRLDSIERKLDEALKRP